MGQTVNVVERASSRPGVVRFETNRVLSGMGHDRYAADHPVEGNRPVDEIARRLFEHGGVAAVHVNSNIITVDLEKGATSAGLAEIVRDLYRYYPDSPAPSGDPNLSEAETAPEAAAEPVVEAAPAESPSGQGEEAAEDAEADA